MEKAFLDYDIIWRQFIQEVQKASGVVGDHQSSDSTRFGMGEHLLNKQC